jgi:hypothetical protein
MEVTVASIIEQMSPGIIAVAVPLIIAGLKKLYESIPPWLIPIIAPALGVLGDAIVGLASGLSLGHGPIGAAIAGLAGVGAREIVDQLRKRSAANA